MFRLDFIWLLTAIALFFFIGLLAKIRRGKPSLKISYLESYKVIGPMGRRRYKDASKLLMLAALFTGFLALSDPRWVKERTFTPEVKKEGRALFLVLDRSSSMKELAEGDGVSMKTRWHQMKEFALKFVLGDERSGLPGRSEDFIGLVSFARSADILVPLTEDHISVAKKIESMTLAKKGTDGTAMGYALYKTGSSLAHLMESSEMQIKDPAILLITDGLPAPHADDRNNPLRSMTIEQAGQFLEEKGIRLYIVNIDPLFLQSDFQPHRALLTRITEGTGGMFFITQNEQQLQAVLKEVDRLEKSVLPTPKATYKAQQRTASLYPLLVFSSLVFLLLSLYFENVRARCFP